MNAADLLQFVGIILYMGLHSEPNVEDYWSNNSYTPNHPIKCYMSLKRFQQIERFFHVCDPQGDNGQSFFFSKLEPLMSHFRYTSKDLWELGCKLSVDEMMIVFSGRSKETVRMRNKPVPCGYKMWALCDQGYVWDFFPLSNLHQWNETVQ